MMFNQLIALYTEGDLAQLSSRILHSTAWKQHDFTAYGSMQINKLWLKSLEQFGFLEVTKQQEIQGDNFSALYIELSKKSTSTNENVSITFFFEHNNEYIKRLHCVVDTLALAKLLQQEPSVLIDALPTPDPLLLSQFDHQLHPKSYHATPNDVCDLSSSISDTVNQWWNIWQEKQLASFKNIYSDSAKIQIAGFGSHEGFKQLRDFQLKVHNRMNRSYCQLENICVDKAESSLAVKWHIDGDYIDSGKIKRIRVPVISVLTIENKRIVEEQLQIDWLALYKQYDLSYPFV
ncbi:nuclear transport factor 2 family protein [Colwellia sp. UCD-KL20]|uniref:nuclear transport factor 2 family protein n=1 Tax=Colwellia sp. UCD-KL20 TaxID=1917165 RepID=UPI0009F867C1|nr:nuclear transport factor 2 family protein [Colwellia sp. UCD-KL20]